MIALRFVTISGGPRAVTRTCHQAHDVFGVAGAVGAAAGAAPFVGRDFGTGPVPTPGRSGCRDGSRRPLRGCRSTSGTRLRRSAPLAAGALGTKEKGNTQKNRQQLRRRARRQAFAEILMLHLFVRRMPPRIFSVCSLFSVVMIPLVCLPPPGHSLRRSHQWSLHQESAAQRILWRGRVACS